ncbi:phytoene desaturase [Xanthobacter dioxanivorans]|uniref:Phytoene desaturase (neurosporene-forming) n=1 Tax=Xanthobacter dioxanivorans TaxID=2528964 RepID=A0A974SMI8_9HYPH|nr:phytoene desaturase [Xanthobacter dioxanivorans]
MHLSSKSVLRAAVIGSGFGGLALAIRLQAAGIATTVFEQRDKPGGRAYVYEDQGFTFDGGPTVITDPSCLEEVFAAAGRRLADYVDLIPVSPFYRLLWPDGRQFDYVNDQPSLDSQIASFNPADVDGYRRFLAYSQAVFEEGYIKLGAVPFLDFGSMMKAAPQLVKLEAWRSVYAMVSRFIRDEHLREAFSFHSLLVGGNPFSTSSIYALIHALERKWGVFFPRGGTGALVRGMVRLFEELGGQVRLSTPVDEIVVDEGRARAVRIKGEPAIPFDIVASNADVVHTYRKLLRGTPDRRAYGERLARKRHSMSLFVIYFGASRTWDHLQHHTVLFGPRYRGLISEIFSGPRLPEDFSLYLHAPTVTDKSLAPEGSTAFYVLSPVPHLGKAEIDWDVEGPRYRDRILAHLEERLLPGLRQSLVTTRLLTPFGFRDELSAHLGSAFSVEPILTQSAWFRPHNRDSSIPNLYFTGAGTHPGAGVPGVVGSAKATAGLILADMGVTHA